jgi:hypothetical protein
MMPLDRRDSDDDDDDDANHKESDTSVFRRDYSGREGVYDCWIYSQSTFHLLLENCVPFAIECLNVDAADAVWKNLVDFQFSVTASNVEKVIASYTYVSLAHLRRAGLEFAAKNSKGRLKSPSSSSPSSVLQIEAWSARRSKKALYFALRLLHFCNQLLTLGKIGDRSSMLAWKEALFAVESDDDWTAHMAVFEPLHASCLLTLRETCRTKWNMANVGSLDHETLRYVGEPLCWCHCLFCEDEELGKIS